MKKKVINKNISVLTGASSGLGREIAFGLCAKGHTVYVVARRKPELLKLKKECKGPGKIEVVAGDLSDSKFREKLISTVLKKEGRIDYLFNNAGYGRSTFLENQKVEEMSNIFEINVVAYAHLISLVLPSMKKRNKGRIINTGSVVAFTPLPFFTLYNASKSAVYALNRSLSYELKGTSVSSTVVLPARMKTGFAQRAYDCYMKDGKRVCVEKFNSAAGPANVVAKNILRKIDKGNEVIIPTAKAGLWYFMRYLGWAVDLSMKNILGPKEKNSLMKIKLK
ncbi:SDR family oxidoreductase [archaeon]|jgi:uncharacterized protein|nr:SDR family oxidoreductase [archaeon]